ncbi:MAG: hypothetical protein ABIY71_10355, partial [Flavobacteriales bacterium]
FQNAKDTGVLEHSNNDHFQCKLAYTKTGKYGPYTGYSDDIRRWTSQEILRVQSGLRLFIITWSQSSDDFQLKELDRVAIPHFFQGSDKPDWKAMTSYKEDLHNYVNSGRSAALKTTIAGSRQTYTLHKAEHGIGITVHEPPLSYTRKTFPSLYYSSYAKVKNDRTSLAPALLKLLEA